MKLRIKRVGPSLEEVNEALKAAGLNGLTARAYARKMRCDHVHVSHILLKLRERFKPAIKCEWVPTNDKNDYAIQQGRFWYAEQAPSEQADNDVRPARRLVLKIRR